LVSRFSLPSEVGAQGVDLDNLHTATSAPQVT